MTKTMEQLLSELELEHSSSNESLDLPPATVDAWCEALGYSRVDFYDAAGLLLAKGFAAGQMSYEFCDNAANALWGSFIIRGELDPFPTLFYEVYGAFDAGEFIRSDRPNENPIEANTRPLITAILVKLV